MPRYFFSIENDHPDKDDEGTELPGPDAARINAVMYLGESLRDRPDMIWDGHRLSVRVTDEQGHNIFKVTVECEDPGSFD